MVSGYLISKVTAKLGIDFWTILFYNEHTDGRYVTPCGFIKSMEGWR
ncbi:MAG: hypothetical protein HPY66_2571 [Firmicutes bacterium]|nr:hypothetical protein [Bacillota bacterium]